MFEKVSAAAPDPILGLTEAFRNDPREGKINLGVGVYKDEAETTPILKTVKLAEQRLLEQESTKGYLSIEGSAPFGKGVQRLLFGAESDIVHQQRARTAHTPGGTGALRVAAEFIARHLPSKRIWVSNPTWANHNGVFQAAGLEVVQYTYYDPEAKEMDFDAMVRDLEGVEPGDVVLLHGCCHNPTGIDPTPAEWQTLAEMSASGGWLPLFDFAYQGFATGLEEDAEGLRTFAARHDELLIASSFSKNFGLYNERVGACTLVAANSDIATAAFSQVKALIRTMYSNPPAHGGAVVTTVLDDPELYGQWEEEVSEMRNRIHEMRALFVRTLKEKGVTQDFGFIERQNGMFSFSGLNPEQVARLRDEFGIYIVGSGRINVAGMTRANMDALCSAIATVL
ncbi:MAG: aspartate/tyrosine/aromatic aminotransferase [Gammaproteobacteria bacterium]